MLKHVRDKVFDFLRNLGSETSSFTQHMQDAVFIIPKASLLQEAEREKWDGGLLIAEGKKCGFQ